jgi:hypothetical protein
VSEKELDALRAKAAAAQAKADLSFAEAEAATKKAVVLPPAKPVTERERIAAGMVGITVP